jgi:hypothetical protein
MPTTTAPAVPDTKQGRARALFASGGALNTTRTSRQTYSPRPRRRLARTATRILAASLASGAAFAALAGTSAAATKAADPGATATPAHYWASPGAPWASPGAPWGAPGRWQADASGMWAGPSGMWDGPAPASSRWAEYFHVASTNPAGPGVIIVTGAFSDGGVEHPGRTIDQAVFNGGSFRIDHSAGHPTSRFNPKTCVGTITQTGPFRVYHGTGRFAGINGSGTYHFDATYTTARTTTGCSKTMTAYIETINGTATLSPSAARNIAPKTM